MEVADAHETIALLQYTGGTTGLSKGAMLTHANLLANLTQLMAIIQQPPEKEHVFLALLPLFHVFGLTITLLLPARMAARVVPMPRYVPADMLEAFQKVPVHGVHRRSFRLYFPVAAEKSGPVRSAPYHILYFGISPHACRMAEEI